MNTSFHTDDLEAMLTKLGNFAKEYQAELSFLGMDIATALDDVLIDGQREIDRLKGEEDEFMSSMDNIKNMRGDFDYDRE